MLVVLTLAACAGPASEASGYQALDLRTGEPVTVTDLRGQPVLLTSWTTWCAECDEVLGGLSEFADDSRSAGVTLVAVNLDAGDVDYEIAAKLETHALDVTLWRDRRNEFRRAFGALGVPTSVLLDADGRVAGVFPGAVDFGEEGISQAIERVLGSGQ
jgi:peroxiredoxin